MNYADKLHDAIGKKMAPVCVGFDPVLSKIPAFRAGDQDVAPIERIIDFGKSVIEVIAPYVPVVKINIAYFEPYGPAGLAAYETLIRESHRAGLLVIGDIKRADIGHTSECYATAHLGCAGGGVNLGLADAVTVNPYFGWDGVAPFIQTAAATGRGVFVLVETSNASASELQGLRLSDQTTVADRVGDLVESWASGEGRIGSSGYSCVGAVVSPRDELSTRRLRQRMKHCLFLVPGFGAQGRTREEVALCFAADGSGAIVNSSRGVIYANSDPQYASSAAGDVKRAIEAACRDFVAQVRSCIGLQT